MALLVLFIYKDYSSLVQLVLSMRIRVRQLKRTELAWRVESAQCLRSPQKLKIFGGPIDKKQRYENE